MQVNKPNIVFILSDDQGAWAMGCAGNEEIITPNIDRLAQEGTLLDRFYCASPVCSPARASLLTGRIPSQHGVHDWLRDDTKEQADIEYLEGQSGYTDILNQAGYQCALSGKWHIGNSARPQKGFSHWYCHKSGGGSYYGAPMYRNGQLRKEEGYVTDAITEDAIDFLQEKHCKPFYLQVGYTAPHAPWIGNHPQEFVALYKDCEFTSLPRQAQHPDAVYLTNEVGQDLRANQIGYFAAVTAMDAGIGRILDTLDKQGLSKNTIVVFSSDNGFSCGHHGFWGKGNGTFPINMYESSVRVPFIIRHSGYIQAGCRFNGVYSAYDWRPTLLDYIGLNDCIEIPLPGRSFAGALKGGNENGGNAVIYDEYGPTRMILSGKYKYIHRYPYGPNLLYDLAGDPEERTNLLDDPDHIAIGEQMRLELETWFAKYTNIEIDGLREPVFGSGQTGKAGLWGRGKFAHSCESYIKENKNFAPYRNR